MGQSSNRAIDNLRSPDASDTTSPALQMAPAAQTRRPPKKAGPENHGRHAMIARAPVVAKEDAKKNKRHKRKD